ncbi:hypothetical protein [Leifsonia sp. LS1]|uniref:hypothetical protein n=1 Tax=Leifsonia sp. LS1 TaxID=2828483 RepID=UPI001CFE26C7|nr:hypothetical protein [Leifsonia sp. LS1]
MKRATVIAAAVETTTKVLIAWGVSPMMPYARGPIYALALSRRSVDGGSWPRTADRLGANSLASWSGMSSRGVRVVRGLVAAGIATFVAALFHVAGGGLPPSALALTLSLTFSGLACIALAGKRAAWWRLVGSVAVSQFLFHALFSMSPAGQFAGATEHVHAGSHLVLVPAAETTSAMPMNHDGTASMWISHVVAALLTVAFLRYGERAFQSACQFTAFQLRRLFTAAMPGPVDVLVRRGRVESLPVTLPNPAVLIGQLRHRGPPVMGYPV